jgi:hypothetical protein
VALGGKSRRRQRYGVSGSRPWCRGRRRARSGRYGPGLRRGYDGPRRASPGWLGRSRDRERPSFPQRLLPWGLRIACSRRSTTSRLRLRLLGCPGPSGPAGAPFFASLTGRPVLPATSGAVALRTFVRRHRRHLLLAVPGRDAPPGAIDRDGLGAPGIAGRRPIGSRAGGASSPPRPDRRWRRRGTDERRRRRQIPAGADVHPADGVEECGRRRGRSRLWVPSDRRTLWCHH